MRLRSWKQLEELIEFVRKSRFGDILDSEYGHTSSGIVKGIVDDLYRRNLSTEIAMYDINIHSIQGLGGNNATRYYHLKEITLELRLNVSKYCVGKYTLYRYEEEINKSE